MKTINKFLQENVISDFFTSLVSPPKEENPLLQKYRKRYDYIYLLHGTPFKNIKSILKNGLDPQRTESRFQLSYIEKTIGIRKSAISLASNYKYSAAYTKKLFTDKNNIFCCKIYTKFLYFFMAVKVKNEYLDEYWYLKKIPPSDLLILTDKRIQQISKKFPYLVV